MNSETGNPEKSDTVEDDLDTVKDDVESNEFAEDTIIMDVTEDDDSLGDLSAEIDVRELVAKIDSADGCDVEKRKIKRRLEDLCEKQDEKKNLYSTYNFNLDDEL